MEKIRFPGLLLTTSLVLPRRPGGNSTGPSTTITRISSCLRGIEPMLSHAVAPYSARALPPDYAPRTNFEALLEEIVDESDSELSDDYGSDVHDELRVVREDLREYKKNKDVNADVKEKLDGFLGEAGVDEGYEDIDSARTILRDKLGGDDDEPYYDSSDVVSFAIESEGEVVSDDDEVEGGTNMRARRKSNRVMLMLPSSHQLEVQEKVVFLTLKKHLQAWEEAGEGMTSNRLVSTPRVINSALVTCDIGYKLSKGLK
ncbi:hypothetical protein RND71_019414 [Anisodus tanguticus]|uniref:Uncharacterized protein n=1 Tax=Anisodus tanguticus TaxID=243964 RepID=A0AAE1RZE4_9SOLA|nr:hypothetical protein RND71_019414 [Anisodus tanguticus]